MYTQDFTQGAAFTPTRHPDFAESFEHIRTATIVEALVSQGFAVQEYKEARTRLPGRQPYVKHHVRLVHPDAPKSLDGRKQLLLTNANDKTSKIIFAAGYWRFACFNGLYIGNTLAACKIPHRHREGVNLLDSILEGAFEIIKDFNKVDAAIDLMHQRQLTCTEQHTFALEALKLRFPNIDQHDLIRRVEPHAILSSRRAADFGSSLWLVFNRIQESLVKGGFPVTHVTPRGQLTKRRTTALRGLDRSLQINRDLWNLAVGYLDSPK